MALNQDIERYRTARISVIDPLSRAIDWARVVLFQPFDIEKWIVLGFCAWLAMLGEHGGGSYNWSHGDTDFEDVERGMHRAWEWVLANLIPILLIGSIVLLVLVAFWLVCRWLSSRGKFMFLDGVVHNRAAVVEPWGRFRAPANSLFVLRIVLDLVGTVIILGLLAGMLVSALVFVGSETTVPLLVMALVFGVLCMVFAAMVFAVVELVIVDFLVPVMYLRGCGVGPAWRELGPLIGARPGVFVLYVLVKLVVSIVVVVLVLLTCCVTCCCVMIPYVGTVILLPLWVLLRAWPVIFLGQFGPEYSRFATLGPIEEPIVEPTPTKTDDPPTPQAP
jgi:hypothetical protein